MLVLTRKKGESVLIGDDIEVSVVKIDESSVKIAIKAPKDMQILRKELYNEVKEENIEAIEKVDLSILKNINR